MTKPQAAALYVRISLDPSGQGLGVARQEEACREWAASHGWTIAAVYSDNDTSASKASVVRPSYDAMIQAVKEGKIDGILCWDMDRLTRQLRQVVDLIELSETTGVQVATLATGEMDITSNVGTLMTLLSGGKARGEMKDKSKRHRLAYKQAAEMGKSTVRFRPFGWSDHTLNALHPVEAPMVQKAATDLLAGVSLNAIAAQWNDTGITPVRGTVWTTNAVGKLMRRWANAGIPVYKGEPLLDTKGTFTPLLERATFDAVKAMLDQRSFTRERGPRKYVLGGLMRCHCGNLMHGAVRGYVCAGEQTRTCYTAVRREMAESRIIKYTQIRIADLAGKEGVGSQTSRRAEIETALVAAQAERDDIASDPDLDLPTRKALLKALSARESALKDESVSMTASNALGSLIASLAPHIMTSGGKHTASIDQAADNRKAVREAWESLDMSQQRLLVSAFGKYTVYPGRGEDRIEIEPLYPDLSTIA